MILNTANITKAEIKKAETQDLLDTYNAITGKSTKEFRNREAAERQTWTAIESLAPGEDISKQTKKSQGAEKSTKEAPVKEKKAEKIADPKKRDAFLDQIIEMTTSTNHKRPNTRAFDKFALLLKYNGKTVREYVAEEGKHPGLDKESGWPYAELRYARDKEFLKFKKAEANAA